MIVVKYNAYSQLIDEIFIVNNETPSLHDTFFTYFSLYSIFKLKPDLLAEYNNIII